MIDPQTGINKGAYYWITRLKDKNIAGTTHDYVDPSDTEESGGTEYVTRIVYGTPLRETKCLFVPEMNDFYTDEELNTIYHSADDYRNAVKKYGLIYKSQKFENADNTTDLLEYAKDYIKNNYHGGISSFDISALDMRLMGEEVRKYTVGLRVNVVYMDPGTKEEARQTLTVISAEYDLNNPENNRYKIGIPDVALNKVYGETSKSGGGGGGSGKTSDETDDETNTEVDGLTDDQDETGRGLTETNWAFVDKSLKEGDFDSAAAALMTAGERDPTGNWWYGLTPDAIKTTILKASTGKFGSLNIGGVDLSGAELSRLKELLEQ